MNDLTPRFPRVLRARLASPIRVGARHPVGGGAQEGRHKRRPAPQSGAGRGDGPYSEGECDAALPGDVVLGLVEAVAVELVHKVTALGADAGAAEAVLEPRPEVAGELGPGAVGAELMHA